MNTLQTTFPASIAAHINSHKTAGVAWPDSAEFAVVYRTSTWPMGWDRWNSITFFDNRGQLDAWLASYDKWSSFEDNHVAFQVYGWDLGPNVLLELFRDGCSLSGPASIVSCR